MELPNLKNTKNLSESDQKSKEAELVFKHILPSDYVVLLDEKGTQLSSVEFSKFLQKRMKLYELERLSSEQKRRLFKPETE